MPAGRVLVVHKQGAINGIRIVRWAGSPGITTAEKVERRTNPAAAAKALRAGQLLQVRRAMETYVVLYLACGGVTDTGGAERERSNL